jgi:hypothetical protein
MGETQTKNGSHEPASSGLSALARVGWMVVGTISMLALAMSIASLPAWSFGVRDVLFWSVTLGTGTLRYIDVTRLEGQTASGEPATRADLWRYLLGLAVLACALWLAAQSVRL